VLETPRSERTTRNRVVSFTNPARPENRAYRRPDIVLYLNGLAGAVIELKCT